MRSSSRCSLALRSGLGKQALLEPPHREEPVAPGALLRRPALHLLAASVEPRLLLAQALTHAEVAVDRLGVAAHQKAQQPHCFQGVAARLHRQHQPQVAAGAEAVETGEPPPQSLLRLLQRLPEPGHLALGRLRLLDRHVAGGLGLLHPAALEGQLDLDLTQAAAEALLAFSHLL